MAKNAGKKYIIIGIGYVAAFIVAYITMFIAFYFSKSWIINYIALLSGSLVFPFIAQLDKRNAFKYGSVIGLIFAFRAVVFTLINGTIAPSDLHPNIFFLSLFLVVIIIGLLTAVASYLGALLRDKYENKNKYKRHFKVERNNMLNTKKSNTVLALLAGSLVGLILTFLLELVMSGPLTLIDILLGGVISGVITNNSNRNGIVSGLIMAFVFTLLFGGRVSSSGNLPWLVLITSYALYSFELIIYMALGAIGGYIGYSLSKVLNTQKLKVTTKHYN